MSGMWIKTADGWREFPLVCPNSNKLEGVYRPTSPKILAFVMDVRVERFCAALHAYHPVHNAGDFRGDHFVEPLTGAFVEKL
jgi:hypothetical protein